MRKHIRKIISTALVAAMLFFAPSVIPSMNPAAACVSGLHPIDTAFALPCVTSPPAPISHAHVPAWPWVVIGCAGSIVVSALAADFWNHRELTTPEAWTCGLLYWVPMQYSPQTNKHH